MRFSEKTLELNICAQVSGHVAHAQRLLWFGLTQKQEARAGFDACTRLGGRLFIFQFKASNRVLKTGERVFKAPHDQMVNLRRCAGRASRSVYYVLPLIGTTIELQRNSDLLSQTYLLDVARLPMIGPPRKRYAALRRNGCHNIYVTPGSAIICSDPVAAQVHSFRSFIEEELVGSEGIDVVRDGDGFDRFWESIRRLTRSACGLIVF